MISITVVVVLYNPVWKKLHNTLKSIVWQKNVDFEIIVADDGSKVDYFDMVENFFKEKQFSNYKLIKNLENQGTVKNILSALKVANGKFIKLISPGDYLYDETTLEEFVKFANKHDAAFYFGNMYYYSANNNNDFVIYNDKKNPHNLHPWIKNNIKKIRTNYLLRRDYICGAAVMYNTKKLSEYLKKISSFVVYAEDCSIIYMIANKELAYYINFNSLWYEYGSGISTQKNDFWTKCLEIENNHLFYWLAKTKLITNWNYKMHFSSSRTERRLLRLIHDPYSYILKLFFSNKVIGYENNNCDIMKLKKIFK